MKLLKRVYLTTETPKNCIHSDLVEYQSFLYLIQGELPNQYLEADPKIMSNGQQLTNPVFCQVLVLS